MSKKTPPERIALTFDLHDLPTAQHRAGLAGLILQIDAMGPDGYSKDPKSIPVIEVLAATSATIAFTRDSMQGVFDELYAAKPVPIVVANKWPGKLKPKPGEFFLEKKDPKTGETKRVPGFGYDVVQPEGPCLKRFLPTGAGGVAWLKLWQQMLWAIPRGGNNVRARAPFIDRAGDKPCGEAMTAWTQLCEFREKLAKSQFKTAPISGALMLGAQAVNAEAVPFAGRVDHNFLLHFWQVVVQTFVPQVVNRKDAKVERVGYVLAIPDVADLGEFRHAFRQVMGGLEAEHPDRTPGSARVDLPDQASLEVLRRLKGSSKPPADASVMPAGVASERAEKFKARLSRRDRGDRAGRRRTQQVLASGNAAGAWGACVRAVESYHMLKLGNNVKLLAFSRVADRPGLVEDYEDIQRHYRNPLFRAAMMRALIGGGPWYGGMLELFAEYPWPFFIEGDDTPRYLPRFGRDARAKFTAIRGDLKALEGEPMTDEIDRLSDVVQRIVWTFVVTRTSLKRGIDLKDARFERTSDKGKTYYDPDDDFREHWKRICSDAFLSMRSRHDQDFVNYFADTICSVPHRFGKIGATEGDFRFLSKILMRRSDPIATSQPELCWQDLKALAMVAVSACSSAYPPRSKNSQGSRP